jgi:hypothetical protein
LETGRVAEENPMRLHLARCPRCSELYIHLLDLTTAPHVAGLCAAPLDPVQVPDGLAGLLPLWRMQLAACNRLDDLRGCAVGLSVLGMIHHQLGEAGEAHALHEMALETAAAGRDLVSRVMSRTDLGALALADGRVGEAREHLARAQAHARRIGDRAGEARVLLLWGDAWRLEGTLDEARRRYDQAAGVAQVLNSAHPLHDVVRRRLELVSGAPPRPAACPAPARLAAYYRGALEGGQQLVVAAHSRECEACAQELAALARRERQGLARRLRGALQVLEAVLVSPQLQAAGVRGEAAGPQVYRAGELEIILNRRPSPTHRHQHDLAGLVHAGGQEPEGIAAARVELYRGGGLIAVSSVNARGHFSFTAVEPGEYRLCLLWGAREILLGEVRLA